MAKKSIPKRKSAAELAAELAAERREKTLTFIEEMLVLIYSFVFAGGLLYIFGRILAHLTV